MMGSKADRSNLEYLVGIDIGTTSVKAALYDTNGQCYAQAIKELGLHYPKPGWVEQNPRDFYPFACQLVQQLLLEANINPKWVLAITI